MKIEMSKLGKPQHSELPPRDSVMSSERQSDCTSIVVLWNLVEGVWGGIRGEHSPGGWAYDPKIWKGVLNEEKTLVVVIPGFRTTDGTGDLSHVKELAKKNGLTSATFWLAPSTERWSINRLGQLFINSQAIRVNTLIPSDSPASPAPSSPRPSGARPSSPRGGSGKRPVRH